MKTKILLVSFFLVWILLSLIPFDRSSKQVTETIGNQEVHEILKRACFDCHSYETKWPWYSYVFPTNFILNHHVQEGREELNFSNWNDLTLGKQSTKIDTIIEEIETKEMPLKSYLLFHPEAKVSDNDLDLLREWQKEVETELLDLEVEDE